MGRLGKDAKYGSAEFVVSYPIWRLFDWNSKQRNDGLPGFVYAQVFYGYGETLLGYNLKRRPQYRIGYRFDRGR